MDQTIDMPAAETQKPEKPRTSPAPCPAAPESLAACGLPVDFLIDLTLKTFHHGGALCLWELCERLRLPLAVIEPVFEFIRAESLCEVCRHQTSSFEIAYQLTEAGRSRARAALEASRYVGPAPVTLAAYTAQVAAQSIAGMHVSPADLDAAFSDLIISEGVRDQFGAAINSTRATLIYGHSGSGKTFIAEHVVDGLNGDIFVPHALYADGQVIQVFDPMVHRETGKAAPGDGGERPLQRGQDGDARWLRCHRPVVIHGGELTLAALDLQFDPQARFYVAPPQLKANGGILIVDDLGRQRVSPQDLMNRWIVPLDRRVDHFVLHDGRKFSLPFDVNVIFSTNLKPAEIADPAFLRRLGYKIHIGEVGAHDYRRIFLRACERARVAFSEGAFRHLLECHELDQQPLLAAVPFDLVSMICDRARYLGTPPTLSELSMEWAWQTYFARE